MIPKSIHFSWISDDPYPPLIQKCIASWKKYAPEFEIIRWDRDRFDTNSLLFTQEAMAHKKWAFVSDVQRLYALYEFGGIYLDSDVELVKPLDELLQYKAFVGHESVRTLSMGILGSEKGHPWVKMLLDYYNGRSFVQSDGMLDMRPNTDIVTALTEEAYGVNFEKHPDIIGDGVKVFPQVVFSPPIIFTGWAETTPDTIAIHYFAGAWRPVQQRKLQYRKRYLQLIKYCMRKLFGVTLYNGIMSCKRQLTNTGKS